MKNKMKIKMQSFIKALKRGKTSEYDAMTALVEYISKLTI